MQPLAKIYQPTKTAMQSGRAKTKTWRLEYEPLAKGNPDALMGWNTMPDTRSQLWLEFPTKEEAIAYAESKSIPFEVIEPKTVKVKPKAYAENFAFTKRKAFDSSC